MTPPATPAIEIQWEAPAPCPDATRVRAATERLLGKSLSGLEQTSVRATGKVTANAAGQWQLRTLLVVGERVEEEVLVARQCSSLADAMALKVALAIDPVAVVEAVQSSQPSAAAKIAPESPPPAPGPRSSNAQRVSFGARVVGQVALGPLPGTTPGVAALVSAQWPSFRVELGGEAFWGGVANYEALPAIGADLQLFAGMARACLTPATGAFRFPICAGPELGVMRGRGFGTAETSSTTGLWGGLALGPALEWRATSRLSLWLEGDAVLTLLKPEFHVRNLPSLYAPPTVAARAAAGLEAHF
ncbi:MAG TPA: hypothetical protein VHB79_37035 [Polyangiaceae bacterium]|nr:hypothetical protein [Polyangiaceae bacterium]